MLLGRFAPILAVLALAGALSTKPVAPFSAGTLRTTTPDLRGDADLRDRPRRRAHLPAGARPRPDRGRAVGEPLLMAAALLRLLGVAAGMIVIFTRPARDPLPARHDRRRPGAVPGQGRRQPGEARRRGRGLGARRPGLHLAGLLPLAARRRRRPPYNPSATTFANLGPNTIALEEAVDGYIADALELERPYTPGLRAQDLPVDMITTSALGHRPPHLGGQRPPAGGARRRGPRRARSSASST